MKIVDRRGHIVSLENWLRLLHDQP